MAFLVAVFPANVYVAVAGVEVDGLPGGWYPWLRLPLQALFVAWALWSTADVRVDSGEVRDANVAAASPPILTSCASKDGSTLGCKTAQSP